MVVVVVALVATLTAASSSGDTGSTSALARGARLITDTACVPRRALAAAEPPHLSLDAHAPSCSLGDGRSASAPDPPPRYLAAAAAAAPDAATTCAAILEAGREIWSWQRGGKWSDGGAGARLHGCWVVGLRTDEAAADAAALFVSNAGGAGGGSRAAAAAELAVAASPPLPPHEPWSLRRGF